MEHFQEKCHAEWAEDLGKMQLDGLTASQKVSSAVAMRLIKQGSMINVWPQALALQALPSNAPNAFTRLSRTCDMACNLAGPAPVDGTWFR